MSTARATQLTETALSLEVQLSNGRTGATALVAVREADTTNSWLDFADATFKTSGWTTRQAAMTEISAGNAPGLYRVALDVTALLPARVAGDELIAEYAVTATSPDLSVRGQDRFLLVTSLHAVAGSVWDELQADHLAAGSVGRQMALDVYEGAVWVDPGAANTNTVVGVDGTPGNPVSTEAACRTLMTATGLQVAKLYPDPAFGTFTLTQDWSGLTLEGVSDAETPNAALTVDINDQLASLAQFVGLFIVGSAHDITSSVPLYKSCTFSGSFELVDGFYEDCFFAVGPLTASFGSFDSCEFSGTATGSAPMSIRPASSGGGGGNFGITLTRCTGAIIYELQDADAVGTMHHRCDNFEGYVELAPTCVGAVNGFRVSGGRGRLVDGSAFSTAFPVVRGFIDDRDTKDLYRGAVWLAFGGAAGTVLYTNGTEANPSGTFADAVAIAAQLGVSAIRIVPATSFATIALDADVGQMTIRAEATTFPVIDLDADGLNENYSWAVWHNCIVRDPDPAQPLIMIGGRLGSSVLQTNSALVLAKGTEVLGTVIPTAGSSFTECFSVLQSVIDLNALVGVIDFVDLKGDWRLDNWANSGADNRAMVVQARGGRITFGSGFGDGTALRDSVVLIGHGGSITEAGSDFTLDDSAFVYSSDTDPQLGKILGLLGEHQVFEVLTRQPAAPKKPLTGILRMYDSAANALLDDGSTGLLRTYDTVSAYDVDDNLISHTMTEAP